MDTQALAKIAGELNLLTEALTFDTKGKKVRIRLVLDRESNGRDDEGDGYWTGWAEVIIKDDNPLYATIQALLRERALALEGEIRDILAATTRGNA